MSGASYCRFMDSVPQDLMARIRISALWIAALLAMIMRDIHEIGTPEFLEMAATLDVPDWLFLVAGVAISVPIMLIPLTICIGRAMRPYNFIGVGLFALGIISYPPGDLDDWWFAALIAFLLLNITMRTLRWPKGDAQVGA